MKPIGHVDEITRYSVSGWAADGDNLENTVRVVVYLNGRECARFMADIFREGLKKVRPGANGKYGFQYSFNPPLSPFRRYEIQVKVDKAEQPLSRGSVVFEPAQSDAADAVQRPSNAILLSTSGRSGSTVMMGILAGHPEVVVADVKPYEVEMLCYYSYALRVMVAAGDHNASLRPDRITAAENRYKIGFNPYTAEAFRRNFSDPKLFDTFFASDLPRRMGSAFKETILDYYAAVARDKGKTAPLYFAEKSLPEHEVRLGSRHMFGRIREVVLVRDLRDTVCSFMKSGGAEFGRTLNAVRSSGQRFLEIKATQGHDVHFVRYEDLVLEPEKTLSALYEFLGLNTLTHLVPTSMTTLFDSHATSRSPSASIGRWRTDLSSEQLEQCQVFTDFLTKFGYEPMAPGAIQVNATPRAVVAPAAAAPAEIVPRPTSHAEPLPHEAMVESIDPHEIPLGELMSSFENLGENCEFGLVQRRCGIEPLGLLRFSSAPFPVLLRALRARFVGLGQSDLIEVELGAGGREYMVQDKSFGFRYHAWANVGEIEPQALHAREVRRLPLLIRKLTEDLAEARKIFVYHGMQPLRELQARNLLNAMQTYGHPTLLWVELDDESHPPGTVIQVMPGLLKGYMNRFAPGDDAHDLSLECWITVCRNAHAMFATAQCTPAAAIAATASSTSEV